jgi:acyl transferase domain-containing protein/acyl carrier protein
VPAVVPTRLTDWPTGDGPHHAGVSAFGMSGTNVHLVLHADAPPAPADGASAGPQLLALAARDDEALAAQADRTAAALRAPDAPGLADAAWTLAVGRSRFERRLAVVAENAADAAARLDTGDGVRRGSAPVGGRTKVAFLFSGQGAQYAGMAAGLYRDEPVFRQTFDRCLDALAGRLDPPLATVLWDAADLRINDTAYAQPALFTVQAGLVALWRSLGVEPDLVLGHSVGEFAAAWAAGVLELEDAARLVAERGRLMQALPQSGVMIAAFAAAAELVPLLEGGTHRVAVASLNGTTETVLSGDAAALSEIGAALDARGIRWKRLAVSHAFHSPLMEPVVAPFSAIAGSVAAQRPNRPWVSTLTGQLVDAAPDGAYWGRQIRQRVTFAPALDELARQHIGCVIEIGPGSGLVALSRRERPEAPITWLASLRPGTDDRRCLLDAVAGAWAAGAAVRLEALHPPEGRGRVTMPGYPFQRRRHWITEAQPGPTDLHPLYGVAWEPMALPEARTPAGRWLVVPDTGGVADALEAAGLPLERIAPAALAERIDRDVAGILHLQALDVAPWATGEGLRPALEGALTLARVAAAMGAEALPMLWVTRAVQSVGEAPAGVAGAALWGLGRTAALEHSEAAPVLLDLPADAPVAALLDLLPRLAACRQAGEHQWAWRLAGGWQAARLVPQENHATAPPVRADRSYLITGGTRGLGLAVALDLARRGARHLLLAGRSRLSEDTLAAVARAGAHAYPVQADVADTDALTAAIAAALAAGAPPLAGVVHAAGVLRDGVLASLDWPAFSAVLAPKTEGLAAVLTAIEGADLDFLALFASGAGVLGSAGQGNYAAANAYLDAAAAALVAAGRPAVSIAWGPWRDLGMAATEHAGWARKGVHALDPAAGLAAFAALVGSGPAVAVLPFDWAVYRTVDRSAFLDRLAPRNAANVAAGGELAAQLAAAVPGERQWLAEQDVWRVVRAVLRLPDETHIDPDRPFNAFGMDSLMALDVRAELASRIGRPLPATLTYDHPTLAALARFLVGDVFGLSPDETATVDVGPAEIAPEPASALRERVAGMDEADLRAYVQRKLVLRRGGG